MNKQRQVIGLLWLFVLLPILAKAQESETMTLRQAQDYALSHANGLKVAQANIVDAELRIKENLATGLPTVKVGATLNYFLLVPKFVLPEAFGGGTASFQPKNSHSANIEVNQLLFSGSYLLSKKAARLYRELIATQLEGKKSEVTNQVIDAYLPALLITESAKTLDSNIVNLKKLLFTVKETQKAGFAEQLDVDRLELSLANLEVERENLDRQKEIVINALKFSINYPQDQNLVLADNIEQLLNPNDQALLLQEINYEKRPEYQTIKAAEQLQALNIDLNKANALPTVAVFGSFQQSIQGNDLFKKSFFISTSLIGLNASYTIWDNKANNIRIERAKLALEQAKIQRTDFERGVSLQVLNARIAVQNSQKRVQSQQKNKALATRIYTTTQTKYKEGVGSSLEIVQAEQELYQAQQNLRQAQFDLLSAQQGLQKALGN